MTDKERLEKLWEQIWKLEMFMRAMKLLIKKKKNTINIKECINEIWIKVSLMGDTLKEEE